MRSWLSMAALDEMLRARAGKHRSYGTPVCAPPTLQQGTSRNLSQAGQLLKSLLKFVETQLGLAVQRAAACMQQQQQWFQCTTAPFIRSVTKELMAAMQLAS